MSVNHKSAKIAIIRKYFYNIMSNSYDVNSSSWQIGKYWNL